MILTKIKRGFRANENHMGKKIHLFVRVFFKSQFIFLLNKILIYLINSTKIHFTDPLTSLFISHILGKIIKKTIWKNKVKELRSPKNKVKELPTIFFLVFLLNKELPTHEIRLYLYKYISRRNQIIYILYIV